MENYLDIQTLLLMSALFCFGMVGLWIWAVHYGPLKV